jgi:hypothetical protein
MVRNAKPEFAILARHPAADMLGPDLQLPRAVGTDDLYEPGHDDGLPERVVPRPDSTSAYPAADKFTIQSPRDPLTMAKAESKGFTQRRGGAEKGEEKRKEE